MLHDRLSSRLAPITLLALLASLAPAGRAAADPIGSGPVFHLGYSGDEDASDRARDLVIVQLGWRWTFDGADCIDDFLARAKTDFSWSVEPVVGGVFGNEEAFEAQLVPFLRFAPLGWEKVVPYFEGGVGIAFTSLRNYALGSVLEFSDNAGVGVSFGEGRRWSIGYRFRHLSHAQLFGDRNEGLNAHFLTVSYQ